MSKFAICTRTFLVHLAVVKLKGMIGVAEGEFDFHGQIKTQKDDYRNENKGHREINACNNPPGNWPKYAPQPNIGCVYAHDRALGLHVHFF